MTSSVTNVDRILSALRAEPGLSDGELRQRTHINPHQEVNQICRRLEQDGHLRRIERGDGRIGNYVTEWATTNVRDSESLPISPSQTSDRAVRASASPVTMVVRSTATNTLFHVPAGKSEAGRRLAVHRY